MGLHSWCASRFLLHNSKALAKIDGFSKQRLTYISRKSLEVVVGDQLSRVDAELGGDASHCGKDFVHHSLILHLVRISGLDREIN